MEYRSFNDLSQIIIKNIDIIPKNVDLVVGIPRSGLLVANMISLILNIPMTDVSGYVGNRLISNGHTKNTTSFIKDCRDAKKVLIIDDSVGTGQSMEEAKNTIKNNSVVGTKYLFGCIYVLPQSISVVDLFFEEVGAPRVFQWNIFHHPMLLKSCFDIDGVLCVDPTEEENDDGEKYEMFLKNATPKIIPSKKIGALVTSRLIKYEAETRDWMDSNRVEYDKLVMMECTFEERRAKGNHAEFKGNFYKASDYVLFVESNAAQALKINQISKKPVYCVENGVFYDGSAIYHFTKELGIKGVIKRILLKTSSGKRLYTKYRAMKNKSSC